MKNTHLSQTFFSVLTSLLMIGSVSRSHAVVNSMPNITLTSKDGALKVYEGTSGPNVFYFVDIVGDSAMPPIIGVAVSMNAFGTPPGPAYANLFIGLGSALGAPGVPNGSPLPAGTYHQSAWAALSNIPFNTAFGPGADGFIWIAGGIPITGANDVDGNGALTTSNAHASRVGSFASDFVAFGPGGTILGGSFVNVPEPSSLLLGSLAGLALVRRRRD